MRQNGWKRARKRGFFGTTLGRHNEISGIDDISLAAEYAKGVDWKWILRAGSC